MIAPLPTTRAAALPECPGEGRWLIDGLWGAEAVGIVGGEPKCCKSFLALELSIAVASGRPCLRRFAVSHPGRVLLFAAEDALHVVRERLLGICAASGTSLEALDLQVITAPSLRLDQESDRLRLAEAVASLAPRLLVLDPFVRLHRIDENVSGEVAPLLAYLRELQREHHLAVAVVHHSRKGAGKARAGQALRGSSEFHAWGDSNLYLRRTGETLALSIEHRAAPSRTGLPLGLVQRDGALALELLEPSAASGPAANAGTASERICDALAKSASPLALKELREACRMRAQAVSTALALLVEQGRVLKTGAGYSLAGR